MAIPRPMPLSDPVTMATFESNCPIILLSFPLVTTSNYSGLFSLAPPAGLEMRPVNASVAPAFVQTGRKEAASEKGSIWGHPDPGRRLRLLHSDFYIELAITPSSYRVCVPAGNLGLLVSFQA